MKTSRPSSGQSAASAAGAPSGFTLVELCVVIIALGLLAALFLPAMTRAAATGTGAGCLANLEQFGRAFQLYAADYATYLPPNPDDGNVTPKHHWVGGAAGVGGGTEFNPDILKDQKHSMLAPYLSGDTAVFHCPADARTGRYRGTDPALANTIVLSARSYSMNQAVGTNPYQSGKAPVNGPWLDGLHGHVANSQWYTYGRTTDMIVPGPANTFLLLDEDPSSLNDGAFACVGPSTHQRYDMLDWPASYHDGGAGISFGDGHAEIHAWLDPRTRYQGHFSPRTQPNNPDIVWLASHATALIEAPIIAKGGFAGPGHFAVTVATRRNTSYELQRADSPVSHDWQTVASANSVHGGALVLTASSATNGHAVFRVRKP